MAGRDHTLPYAWGPSVRREVADASADTTKAVFHQIIHARAVRRKFGRGRGQHLFKRRAHELRRRDVRLLARCRQSRDELVRQFSRMRES